MEHLTKEITFGKRISEQRLRSDFVSVRVEPPHQFGPKCRLVIPKAWKQAQIEQARQLAVDRFTILAAFSQSDDVGVQVLATLMPWEVNLVDWLEYQAHIRQIALHSIQSAETEWGQTVHAVGLEDDKAFLRIIVAGDGRQLVLLIGRMPLSASEAVAETLGLAAASLDFPAHSGKTTRESLVEYNDEGSLFQVIHPSSWTCQALDTLRPAKSGADFRITNERDTLAYLRIAGDTRPDRNNTGLEELYRSTLDELKQADIMVHGLERVRPSSTKIVEQRWVGGCAVPSGEGQLAFLLRLGSKAWLSAVLVCPAKTVNPHAWMRGKRAFEIACATLR